MVFDVGGAKTSINTSFCLGSCAILEHGPVMDPRGAEGRVNADTRAVVSGFLGAWTDPMGNNVQVKEVCNELRVSFTDGCGKSDTWKLRHQSG